MNIHQFLFFFVRAHGLGTGVRVWGGFGVGKWVPVVALAAALGGDVHGALSGTAGGTVGLSWDQNPEAHVAGYRVHYGLAHGVYTEVMDVGKVTSVTLSGLDPTRRYYSVLVAYGTEGQVSPASEEISFTPEQAWTPLAVESLPAPPANDPGLVASAPTIADWGALPGGDFGFTVTAAPGKSLAVYASHDMLNWELLGVVGNTTGRLRATDRDAGQFRGRYYQVVPAP